MRVERWRKVAFQMLPVFWRYIEEAENVKALWNQIYLAVEQSCHETSTDDLIRDVFAYESWCMSESRDEEVQDAVLNFYMEIPLSARLRRALPLYMSVDDFLGSQEIFAGQLTPEEFEAFRDEFLAAAEKLKPA